MTTQGLVEYFFRHEYARLVAVISRRVGIQHLAATEDAVQSALIVALDRWKVSGPPDNPSAWLFRVAYNDMLAQLRQGSGHRRILAQAALEPDGDDFAPEERLGGEVQDDLLRMVFVCCDDAVPLESQIVLALKVLCGFGIREIALRLFTSEANVYKRLSRARARLNAQSPSIMDLAGDELAPRVPAVCRVLYALFSEGYLSARADAGIRRELCEEAIRLTTLLAEHKQGGVPEVHALLALMQLHTARLSGRHDSAGGLLLLEEQDRSLWDTQRIGAGLAWLATSAAGENFSRYHAEAGIAAEHCLAPSFAETRWERVVSCYALLEAFEPSPLHRLNRAVAVAEWRGAPAGLAELEGVEPPPWLGASHLWPAVLADLHARCGHTTEAERYRVAALEAAPNAAVRDLLQRRLERSAAEASRLTG